MNKRIPIYHYACFGALAVSMILPYKQFDWYTPFTFFGNSSSLIEANRQAAGISLPEVWILLGFIVITSFIVLIKKNMATAIIGLITSFGAILYLPLLAFILTFTLFGQERNATLSWGYILGTIAVVTYFGFTIANLVVIARARKKKKAASMENDDIIDNTDLLDGF